MSTDPTPRGWTITDHCQRPACTWVWVKRGGAKHILGSYREACEWIAWREKT